MVARYSSGDTPASEPRLENWISGDAVDLAPRLLGCTITVATPEGTCSGVIVETEAYHGERDPASHAARGRTPRTAPMFESGGYIYVYQSYGLHRCLNIVTGPPGEAQAVLLRALEPVSGLELMRLRRPGASDLNLTSGPGKLCQALGVTLDMSGSRLGGAVELIPGPVIPPAGITVTPRIGITKARYRPWRFYVAGNPYVSRP